MPRVVFVCGAAGSGKSTVARALEAEGLVRVSIDEEAWGRGFRSMPIPQVEHSSIEAFLWDRVVTLLGAGRDVVLDYSFWSRGLRAAYRQMLLPLGVVPEIIYVTTNRNTALGRIATRTNSGPNDFCLPASTAAAYFDNFEPPTDLEGPLTVVRT